MKILFLGDTVGKAGRRAVCAMIPKLIDHEYLDLVVVNCENATGGIGIDPKTAEEFFAAGTSSGKTKFLIKYGMLYFSINGKDLTLAVYQSQRLLTNPIYKDYLFLPFNDLSNGDTTYSGGRFIDLIIPKGNTILVDFN